MKTHGNTVPFFVWLVGAQLVSGCATILDSPPYSVRVKAIEDGKSVPINAKVQGVREGVIETKLPAELALTPLNSVQSTVIIADDCFDPSETPIFKRINPYSLLNVFTYGAGFLVDAFTGAIWDFSPETVVPLRRKAGNESCGQSVVIAQGKNPAVAVVEEDKNPAVSEGAHPVELPSANQLLRHNFSANTNNVLRYSSKNGLELSSGRNNQQSTTIESVKGLAYEYLFSRDFGLMLSLNQALIYRLQPSTVDTYGASLDASMSSAEILLKRYVENIPALNVGIGLGGRRVSTHYNKKNDASVSGIPIRNELKVHQQVSYLLISVGMRTRDSLFFGVDMHLTSPSLIFYNDGGRTTAQTREQQFALINDAQDRKAAEQLHTSLLSATQVNLQLGMSF